MILLSEARVCCIDIWDMMVDEGEGGKEDKVKAQVSTTCVPEVLTILIVWPARRGVAMP